MYSRPWIFYRFILEIIIEKEYPCTYSECYDMHFWICRRLIWSMYLWQGPPQVSNFAFAASEAVLKTEHSNEWTKVPQWQARLTVALHGLQSPIWQLRGHGCEHETGRFCTNKEGRPSQIMHNHSRKEGEDLTPQWPAAQFSSNP